MKKCPQCKKEVKKKENKFCSQSCAASYNNKKRTPRTDESKKRTSLAMQGRKLSEKHIEKLSGDNHHKRKGKTNLTPVKHKFSHICPVCEKSFLGYETQKTCSRDCKHKLFDMSAAALTLYRNKCKFKFRLSDYPDEFDFSLIEKHGMYSAANRGNNADGVSRDHMYSISEGFKNNIPPEIISHPANCQLLLHKDNNKKHGSCSISLDDLEEKISAWNEKYSVPLAE